MDEWERRLANVLGIEQPVSKPKSLSISDSRDLVFIIKNRSSGEVLLTVPIEAGSGSGAATPALTAAQKRLREGTLQRILRPGGSAKIARSDLVGNEQIQQLIRRGILVASPAE